MEEEREKNGYKRTKEINCNMWRGPYTDKDKCQPEYDTSKKGDKVQERGYKPQYYKVAGKSSWTAKPTAKRLTEQLPNYWDPKTNQYIILKKVEFKEHEDNGMEKPKDNPKPSDL